MQFLQRTSRQSKLLRESSSPPSPSWPAPTLQTDIVFSPPNRYRGPSNGYPVAASYHPNIQTDIMARGLDHFRRQIVQGAAKRVALAEAGCAVAPRNFLENRTPAEVGNFHFVVGADQQILRFQIAVDNVSLMQMIQTGDHVFEVSAGLDFRKRTSPPFQELVAGGKSEDDIMWSGCSRTCSRRRWRGNCCCR